MNSCIHGHEMTPENTYVRPKGKIHRECRQCRREANLRYQISHPRLITRVDNNLLREIFLRESISATSLARACGWTRAKGKGDSTSVLRRLGLQGRPQETMRYTDAVRIALALGCDPTEVDL